MQEQTCNTRATILATVKRASAVLLFSILLLSVSLAACGDNPPPEATQIPVPSSTPTPVPTETPTPSATPTPVPNATPTAPLTPTPVPTATPRPTATQIPVPSSTPTPVPTETPTPSATPTPVPNATPTATLTPTPVPTATPRPTATSTPRPTATPPRAQSASDRAVLVALYHSTGGANWDDNTNWLSDRPIGEWHGVTTNSNGRIIRLALQDNNLTGTLPAEFGGLSNLTDLVLYNNHLTGEIPPELGGLLNLTALSLYANQLTGEIPPELGGLSNLMELYLTANQLTGEIPPELGRLSNLTGLALNYNRLRGEIPPELGGLTNLIELALHGNELTGGVPTELGDLSNLTWLSLESNHLTGCIPEGLRAIANNDLASLNLPDCSAATPIPTPISAPTPRPLPNLVVDPPTVSLSSPMAGQSFKLNVTVRNRGNGSSALTAVSYYRSTDSTITSADTQVGADRVPGLGASESSAESILTYAPPTTGTYYFGACVDAVSGESDTTDNCSAVVSVTVSEFNLESLPWVRDGITGSERAAMDHIRALAQIDSSMSQRVAGSPWLSNGVSENELGMMADLRSLADTHPEVAVLVTTVPDDTGRLMADALLSLRQLLSSDPGRSEQFLSQAWFQDGLTEEEAALIVVLRPRRNYDVDSEKFFADLLQGGHVRSETISLPLAGEVDLFAVGRSERDLQLTLERMAIAVESMEGFMGAPWPKPDVIVLLELESDLGSGALGWNSYSHVVLKRAYRNLTYHELAHYYAVQPQWLSEGTAEFLSSYAQNWTGGATKFDTVVSTSLDGLSIARECAPLGAANIQGWIETMPGGTFCVYTLGKHFLAVMYRNLGHEVVSSALRELHDEARPQGRVATEDEIYQAFLTNTSPSQRDDFRDLYHCLHGRPIPGYTAAPKAASSPEIRDALVALYNATNGAGWKNSGNWLTDAPLDQWHGVVTDCDGSLVGLILYQNQLTGPIPAELGDLSALETLILSGNQLTGPSTAGAG